MSEKITTDGIIDVITNLQIDIIKEVVFIVKKRKQRLISEFVEDLKKKDYFWKGYRSHIIEKWEEKLR